MKVLSALPSLAMLAILVGLMQGAFALLPEWESGWAALGIALACFVTSGAAGYWLATRLSFVGKAWQLREDQKALGRDDDEERYTGVSFTSAVVLVGTAISDLDTSLDRGWVRWEGGYLCFRGYGPGVRLPAEMIDSVRVVPPRRLLTLWVPQAVVEWRHPDGTVEQFCLEARLGRSFRGLRVEAERLCEFLESGLRKALAESPDLPCATELPMRSTVFEEQMLAALHEPRRDDYGITASEAVTVIAGTATLIVCLFTCRHPHLDNVRAAVVVGLFPVLCLCFFELRRRWRRQRR
jgi:hypothetical protein